MSKQKIRSDFNRLKCSKTEKIFAATWSLNRHVEIFEISCAVERMVLPGGSKPGKNESYDPDTLRRV